MRFDFARVKSILDGGSEVTLTYRNRPLARIVPIEGAGRRAAEEDPALTFGQNPESIAPMNNEEIDRAIYG